MNRTTVFSMTNFGRLAGRCVTLAAGGLLVACSGETFTSLFEGGLPDAETGEAAPAADSGERKDVGELDAPASEAAADGGTDAYVCPTGVQACLDAIALLCSRQKGCGSQTCDDMNTSTGQCSGKTVCETPCLQDIQNASCTWINQHSTSPAFVSGSCGALW